MLEQSRVQGGGCAPSAPPGEAGSLPRIVGQSDAFQQLNSALQTIASRLATVLLEGETGVGKEVVAREIHALSQRASGPFIPVDCTAFSSQLIESQLFGHVRGAFTGAVAAAKGFIRCADRGTLFLDEVGELPLEVQAKLLRSLQERTVVPVGGAEPIRVDVRIIAATHRDLAQMVRCGTFRQDLFFRLNVVRISIQPLRERRDDILPLARHFLQDVAWSYQEPVKLLTPRAADALARYDWPGNVRELRNAVERAFLFCADRTIDVAHLPSEIRDAVGDAANGWATVPLLPAAEPIPRLADAERLLIARALRATGGHQADAARILGVERHRLRRMITSHRLEHLLRRRPR